MKKIEPYKVDAIKKMKEIISSKKDKNMRRILTSALPTIKTCFDEYEKNKSELYNIKNNRKLSNDQISALKHCYDGETNIVEELKNRVKSLDKTNLCPLCQLEGVATIDHYLPKSSFPEYATLSINLMPCCYACNTNKGNRRKNDFTRNIINIYFDEIPKEQFLFLEFNIVDNVIFWKYYFDDKYIKKHKKMKDIIDCHLIELKLNERYEKAIHEEITNFIYSLTMKENTTIEEVSSLACEEAEKYRRNRYENYRKKIIYETISNDKKVCEYLLKNSEIA